MLDAPNGLLKHRATEFKTYLAVRERAGIEDALNFLSNIRYQSDRSHPRRAGILEAYKILAHGLAASKEEEQARFQQLKQHGEVKLYCRPPQGTEQWLSIAGHDGLLPVYNDDPLKSTCLMPHHGYAPEMMLDRVGDEDRKKIIQMLSVPCLRNEALFSLKDTPRPEEPNSPPDPVAERLDRLMRLLAAKANQPDSLRQRVERITKRQFCYCESISRRFTVNRPESPAKTDEGPIYATWSTDRVYFSGKPTDYAPELRGVFLTLLGEEGLPGLGLRRAGTAVRSAEREPLRAAL